MKPVLTISLVFNLVLVAIIIFGASMTGRLVQSNLLQPAYERSVSLYDVLPIEAGDLVMLGDSLVSAAPWHELLPGLPVRTRGVIGDTSAGVLGRLDQVIAGQPAMVMIMAGTFDIQARVPRRTTVANMARVVERLQAELPNADVLLMGVLPRSLEKAPGVHRLNQEYAAIAERTGVYFLDLTEGFTGSDGTLDPAITNDGLHLNGEGYLRWRDRLRPWIESRLEQRERAGHDSRGERAT